MKLYIKSTSSNSYLYIFKHGIGPGTLPKDVNVIRWKDLPNHYTAVWLDRFLTTSEMDQYDIPYETEINKYLDWIGYCQKDGDVVPCDDVEAFGDIKASTTNKYFADMVSCSMNGTQAIAYRNIKHCFENLTGEWYNCILDGCLECIPDSLEEAKQLVYEECLVNKYDKGYCGSGKAPKEMRFAGTQFIRDSIDKLFSEDKDGDVACCAEEKGWH